MRRALDGKVCEVGLQVSRWMIDGAAATTTVVLSPARLPDPVGVLEAVAAASPASVRKIALIETAGESDTCDAYYTFAELVRANGLAWLDLTAECGHSMIAASAQIAQAQGGDAPRTVRVASGRSGKRRIVACSLRESGADSFTASVRFPVDLAGARPLGEHPIHAAGIAATVVDCGNPYAFVDAVQLGLTSPDELFMAGDDARLTLLEVRRHVAPLLGFSNSLVLPKPALVLRTSADELYVRAVSVDDWHPAIALTGLVASAAFMDRFQTGGGTLRITSPGGANEVRCETEGDEHFVVVCDRKVRRT